MNFAYQVATGVEQPVAESLRNGEHCRSSVDTGMNAADAASAGSMELRKAYWGEYVMKRITRLALGLATFAALGSGAAHADIVSLDNVTAEWFGAVPASNATYGGDPSAPTVRWGGASGYDFVLASDIDFEVPPSPSETQVIGEFNHVNFPITAGTSITQVNLRITADVVIDGLLVGNRVFEYGFDHFETPNADSPCADGGFPGVGVNVNGCADRVIINWLASSSDFAIGGDLYTLNILGFSSSSDALDPFTEFWTAEGQNNLAYLVANVTLRSDFEVPEPGTLALLGLGLFGVGVTRRRRPV